MIRNDYDGAWKEALEQYFEQFVAFFFPHVHREVDWTRRYEFLDKELRSVVREAELGPMRVDKLAKVWTKWGGETWVLIHIEIQSQAEETFAQRMFAYHYRLLDRYQHQVASFAVLADEHTHWRPNRYQQQLWGCKVDFVFPAVKLADYRQQWKTLLENPNPFATVVMAHLKAQETHRDVSSRRRWKVVLTKRLYELGYSKQDVLNLFRFIDWLLILPEAATKLFWQEVSTFEEEKKVSYITSIEQYGLQQGLQRGLQQGLQRGLQQGLQQGLKRGKRQGLLAGLETGLVLKFGPEGLCLMTELRELEDISTLQSVLEALKTASSLEELQKIYQPSVSETPPTSG